jgi:hypothetical protein
MIMLISPIEPLHWPAICSIYPKSADWIRRACG